MKKITEFIKKEVVLTVAWLLAIISMFIVKPDAEYIDYMDFKTLGILFSLMAVMAGLKGCGFFTKIAHRLLGYAGSQRGLEFILVFLCFFFSMFITNDVALITFVPFALVVLKVAGRKDRVIPVVVMQTIAANMGSMATPIGNPHNLYLYSKSGISALSFIGFMLPYTVAAMLLIMLTMLVWSEKGEKVKDIEAVEKGKESYNKSAKEIIYLGLFLLSVLSVVNIIPIYVMVIIILVTVVIMDKTVLFKVDYYLLFTFVGFFIFVGNMGRISAFQNMINGVLEGNEFILGALLSQVISNVPTSILLSGFTKNWQDLIIGTNIGGLGTLIASMASLISFKLVSKEYSGMKGKYFVRYTQVNFVLLILMIIMFFVKEQIC